VLAEARPRIKGQFVKVSKEGAAEQGSNGGALTTAASPHATCDEGAGPSTAQEQEALRGEGEVVQPMEQDNYEVGFFSFFLSFGGATQLGGHCLVGALHHMYPSLWLAQPGSTAQQYCHCLGAPLPGVCSLGPSSYGQAWHEVVSLCWVEPQAPEF
jgi:hypothetical protein